jgi:hypothetical protein
MHGKTEIRENKTRLREKTLEYGSILEIQVNNEGYIAVTA